MADMDLQIKIEALTREAAAAFEGVQKSIDAIAASVEQASKEMNKAEKAARSLGKIGDGFNKIGEAAKKAGQSMSLYITAPLLAIGALAIKEFSDAQNETNKLNQALANSGRYTREASEGMIAFADALEKVSTFSSGAIVDSLALASQFSRTNEQAQELVKASADLATFMGTDLNSAVRTLGMTMNGQAGRVGQLVKGVSDLTEEQLRAGAAIGLVAQQMGGQAAAAAQTLGGQITILKNELNTMLEQIGKDLAPIVGSLVQYLRELVTEFTNMDVFTRRLIVIFGALAASLGPLLLIFGQISTSIGAILKLIGPLVGWFSKLGSATLGTVGAVAALGLAVAGLVNVFLKLRETGDSVAQALLKTWNLVAGAYQSYVVRPILDGIGLIIYSLSSLPGVASTSMGQTIQNIGTEIGALADKMGVKFQESKGVIDDQLKSIGSSAGDAFTFGFSTKVSEMIEALKKEIDDIKFEPKNLGGAGDPLDKYLNEKKALAHQIGMSISSSLSNAFLDFASGAKSASEAFKDFASSTLRQLTQMIIQAQIFRALFPQGAAGSAGLMGLAGAGFIPAPGMATGGPVIGPGTGTSDSILTRLSNGEFVVRADAVKSVGVNFLSAINSMGSKAIPKFANGGMVSGGGTSSVVIENKGTEKQATSSSYDAKTGVTTIVLEDIQRNGPIFQSLQAHSNVKRGGFR